MESGIPEYGIIEPHLRADGTHAWAMTNKVPLRDTEGNVVGVLGTSEDITERKRAEEALQESERKFRLVTETIQDVFWMSTPGVTEMIYISPGYKRIWGKSMESLYESPRSFLKALHPEDLGPYLDIIETFHAKGKAYEFEYRIVPAAGRVRWIQERGYPITDDQGNVVLMTGICTDTTERKQVEEMKDNLIRDVSHELKTPLAKMQMSVDLLTEMMTAASIDRQEVARASKMIAGNVQRLQHTVSNILDLSSLESGQMPYHETKLRPKNLIRRVILDMQPLAEGKGLELVAELPKSLPQVIGDQERLLRVLTNLVDNAVKFTDQGKVVVSARRKAHEVEIAVSDSGRGILGKNLDRVFERFWQERPSIPGAGVGLAICKTIVEAHGGKIWAESAGRGQGTTIRFTLPMVDD